MPADPCTGALWRRLPTGLPSMAQPPRHKSPVSVPGHKVAHGALGSLPNLYAIIRERSFSERYRVAHPSGSPGGARSWQPQRLSLRGLFPRCCGRGLAWKALWDTGWHGFPASAATTVAGRRPACLRLARCAAPGGGGSGGSDPVFFGAGAPRAGGKVARPLATFPPLVLGVAPSTVVPGGKAVLLPVARGRVAVSFADLTRTNVRNRRPVNPDLIHIWDCVAGTNLRRRPFRPPKAFW